MGGVWWWIRKQEAGATVVDITESGPLMEGNGTESSGGERSARAVGAAALAALGTATAMIL